MGFWLDRFKISTLLFYLILTCLYDANGPREVHGNISKENMLV